MKDLRGIETAIVSQITKVFKKITKEADSDDTKRKIKCLFYSIYCFIKDNNESLTQDEIIQKVGLMYDYPYKHYDEYARRIENIYANISYKKFSNRATLQFLGFIVLNFDKFIYDENGNIDEGKKSKIEEALKFSIAKYYAVMKNYKTQKEQRNHMMLCFLNKMI